MREIKLTQGFVALVDDEDYEEINKRKWHVNKNGHTYYALSCIRINGIQSKVSMHRVILGIKDKKILVDHGDRNGLNNQRYNLRESTGSQNQMNKKTFRGSSQFKGISWVPKTKSWRVLIHGNGSQKNIGNFKDEVEAAKAYDAAAIKYFGEFAFLNFQIQQNDDSK